MIGKYPDVVELAEQVTLHLKRDEDNREQQAGGEIDQNLSENSDPEENPG